MSGVYVIVVVIRFVVKYFIVGAYGWYGLQIIVKRASARGGRRREVDSRGLAGGQGGGARTGHRAH